MDRDALIASYRSELDKKPEEYFLEVFHMLKSNVVNPDEVWNLNDIRELTQQHLPNDISHRLERIHAEIWGRTLILLTSLHNLVVQTLRDGGTPKDDPKIRDHIKAINLISLQYGVFYYLDDASKLSYLLVHDEGLRLHISMGGVLPRSKSSFVYDVALSFAGEDRAFVKEVASELKENGIRVFYDEFEKAKLWGKDLYQYLSEVYKTKSLLSVIFISEHYANKLWTSHELKSLQARAFEENKEYILPVRFDETKLPGLHDTVAYIDGKGLSPSGLCELIGQKLNILWPDNKSNSS